MVLIFLYDIIKNIYEYLYHPCKEVGVKELLKRILKISVMKMNKLLNNLAIIQARTSSNRLPGKVLKEICGMPMILFQINRLKKSKNIDKIVLTFYK